MTPWGWPESGRNGAGDADTAHYFQSDGISACGKWTLEDCNGAVSGNKDNGIAQPNDCEECLKVLGRAPVFGRGYIKREKHGRKEYYESKGFRNGSRS